MTCNKDVFTLTVSLPDESWCTSLVRNGRWDKGRVECPRCNSYNIKKDGRYRLYYQKYFCKQCERGFNDNTGTTFHYSHTPLKKWFLAIYLYFVLWPGCSARAISLELVVYTISKMLQIYQNSCGEVVFIIIY
jgi:transposase-like protein